MSPNATPTFSDVFCPAKTWSKCLLHSFPIEQIIEGLHHPPRSDWARSSQSHLIEVVTWGVSILTSLIIRVRFEFSRVILTVAQKHQKWDSGKPLLEAE